MIKSHKEKLQRKHHYSDLIIHFSDPGRIDKLHNPAFKESLIFSMQWLKANYTEFELWDDDLRTALVKIQRSHVFELKFLAHKMLCGCSDAHVLEWIDKGGH